jgi:hypothetical protein
MGKPPQEQRLEWAEAVAVRPFSVQTRLPPVKGTLKTRSRRPGRNVVGWPRFAGAGVNLLFEPIGMATDTLFSFL